MSVEIGYVRRSTRNRKPAKAESNNNEEENRDIIKNAESDPDSDLQSSGSDFEKEMQVENVKNKMNGKKKEMKSSSSSSDEAEIPEDDHEPARKKLSRKKSMRKSSAHLKRKLNEISDNKKKSQPTIQINSITSKETAKNPADTMTSSIHNLNRMSSAHSHLILSESSSEEEDKETPVIAKKPSPTPKPEKTIINEIIPSPHNKKKIPHDEVKAEVTSQLDALASNLAQTQEPWTQVKTSSPTKRDHKIDEDSSEESPSKKFAMEVAEALAMGEKKSEPFKTEESESENEEEKQEQKDVEPLTGDIEIAVALPDKRSKKKKAFDLDGYVKREISKAKREYQLMLHQAHIVCLLAHLKYTNQSISTSPLLLGVALSVIPLAHLSTPKQLNSIKVTQLMAWFKSAFRVNFSNSSDRFPSPLIGHLIRRFENHSASSNEDLVLMFLLITRAMGWNSRLVLNFATVPLKPGKEETNLPIGPKEISNEPSTSKIKSEEKEEKSPYFSKEKKTLPSKSTKSCSRKSISNVKASKKVSSPANLTTEIKDKRSSKKVSSPANTEIKDKRSSSRRSSAKGTKKYRDSSTDNEEEEEKIEHETKKKSSKSSNKRSTPVEKMEVKPEKNDKSIDNTSRSSSRRSRSSGRNEKEGSSKVEISKLRKDKEKHGIKNSPLIVLSKTALKEVELRKKGRENCRRSINLEQNKISSAGRSSTKGTMKYRDPSTDDDEEEEKKEQETKKKSNKSSNKRSTLVEKLEIKPEKIHKSDKPIGASSAKKCSSNSKNRENGKRRNSSGDEFESMVIPKNVANKKRKSDSCQVDANKGKKSLPSSAPKNDYWVEILIKKEWICVDVIQGKVNCHPEMEERASKPMFYVIGCNPDGTVKDVTRRYAKGFMTGARKQRVDSKWLDSTLSPYLTKDKSVDRDEEKQLNKMLESAPMPQTVSAFKDHPLYALQRHLLKFEAIYPPDAPTLGFLKTEAIYARECVRNLHCRVTWLKEGRIVKLKEDPYKIVKARPKWDRMTGTVTKDQPLELFGEWQTQLYVAPPAKDGKVPRNEYGNVELFKPWMLPKGTVHMQLPGLNRIARKLNIDCAAAMFGWDYHDGRCHPVFDGFVVCEEFQDTLMDAWNADADERARKEEEKREKRVLDNWKKLVKGSIIAHKIKMKYMKD